jgi:transposase
LARARERLGPAWHRRRQAAVAQGARQGLEALRTPEDMPIPQNTLDEIRRDMALLAMLRVPIKAIEQSRLERLEQAPVQRMHG